MYSKLTITDGTERISFLTPDDRAGFNIEAWRPGIAEYKGGGTWQDSPIADGRQLAYTQWSNTVESWGFKAWADDADGLIRRMQDLKRLLIKAVEYWATSWQTEPVWIEAVSPCETYTRYALIRWWALPEEEFPYGGTFYQATGGAAMDNLTLMLEHLHWTDTIPGVGTATQISAQQAFCYPWCLTCDGDTQSVNCGSDAGLDNLPDFAVSGKGQITVDGWIRADSYGEGNQGAIANKLVAGQGWIFRVDSANGLYAAISCAAQNAISRCGLDEFTADGEWHHVLMTYDETGAGTPAARTIYMAIDGVWVTSYVTQQVSIGNYVVDAAGNMYLANIAAGTLGFDGCMGWQRISGNIRYNPGGANFTPQVRCTLPSIDTNTLALWIREGTGTTIDNAEGTAARDGTAVNAAWECDCNNTVGRTATTNEGEVFVANKHNLAQLTHILWYDSGAGTWSRNFANYGGAFSFDILDDNAGSAIYFGIDSSAVNGGPFCSLVFDLTAALLVNANAWEYWNGAWVALATQDNTNDDGAGTGVAFNTTGVKSVHWIQPADWTPVSLLTAVGAGASGVTAYWVRLRVTAGAGAGVAVQTSRPIYTIVWPYIDVDEAQVPGDIPALLQSQIHNQSSDDPSGGSVYLWTHRVIAAVRSLSRGSDFTPYINLADEQNNSGITVAVDGAVCTFATDTSAPSGRSIWANLPAGGPGSISVSLSKALSIQYLGTFHAFLRLQGMAGLTSATFSFLAIIGNETFYIRSVTVSSAQDWIPIDLGQFSTPSHILPSDDPRIAFGFASIAGNADLYFYDLILMPVDEWAADIGVSDETTTSPISAYNASTYWPRKLNADSITMPKSNIRAFSLDQNDDYHEPWIPITPESAILQQNTDQRLWFFVTRDSISPSADYAEAYIAHSLQTWRQARYLNQRGAR